MVLTKPPVEYDINRTEPREVSLVAYAEQELCEALFEVPVEGVLEWMNWKDGDVVSERTQVTGITMDRDMSFSFGHVFLPLRQSKSSVLSPAKSLDALYTLRAGNIVARGHTLLGILEATGLKTLSLQVTRDERRSAQ